MRGWMLSALSLPERPFTLSARSPAGLLQVLSSHDQRSAICLGSRGEVQECFAAMAAGRAAGQ